MPIDIRGKTIVLTGTFSKLKRADAEAALATLGAKISGSVSKATHVLFAGEKAGSKINDASRLGVTVLGEDDLMAVLAAASAPASAPAADAVPAVAAAKPGAKSAKGATPAIPAILAATASPFAALDPALPGPALAAAIEALPWDALDVDRDVPALREALDAHEAAHGGAPTEAHRAATARLRPRAVLRHAHGHDVEVRWTALSPDGRFLATGSWTGADYERGGVLQIWDVRAGRCVNMLRVRGGVGWPDYPDCIQWRPDGRRVGLAFDTNGVGSFDPFGKTGEPDSCAYVTDGWSRPPAWAWSPNSRDVYIACWGPGLALGAIVPLVGRRPAPRWCQRVERSEPGAENSEPRLQPLSTVSWAHPDRIAGISGWSQTFAIDAKSGRLLWEGKGHPPVAFAPDGETFVMHPAGLVFYDTRTGLPNGKLPMHVGAASVVWSRDGRRAAALVQPGNAYNADPGVFVYDGGEYRYSPDVGALRPSDRVAATWSPDGRRLAVTARGRLQLWDLGGDAPAKLLDVASPADGGVAYGDGALQAWTKFGLAFFRERDGALLSAFRPAVEARGESPLQIDGDDLGARWEWNPAFPLDDQRVAAALPEGVVIGPPDARATVEEVDARVAWVIDRKWAWPWRWGEATVWPDAAAACADPAAPPALKRAFGKKSAAARAPSRGTKSAAWPPDGGALEDVAALVEPAIQTITDGYHGADYRRKYAARTMALGYFDRAARAIDGGGGWAAWGDPWFAALAARETVMAALADQLVARPPLTDAQRATVRRWLDEAEARTRSPDAGGRPGCEPLAAAGAAWILLGERARGEQALSQAVAAIDPEPNSTQHRRAVAVAFATVGRAREAITHLTSAPGRPSWTEAPTAIAAIARRASPGDLAELHARLKATGGHNEFALLERGLARLIELRAWDAARAWLGGFEGLSTSGARVRLATAMAAAGEPDRAASVLEEALAPTETAAGEFVLALARLRPERARAQLEAVLQHPAPAGAAFQPDLAGAAARVGALDLATRAAARAPDPRQQRQALLSALVEIDPADDEWGALFERARATAADGTRAEEIAQLAAVAHRGGRAAESAALLDVAIEAAREEPYADISLEAVSGHLARAGDLAGAYRAWRSIAKGTRTYRVGPLLDACVAAGRWAAAVDVLRQMSMDLNGAPQRALKILLDAAGGEGW